MVFIYILQLEQGKYYVGKTTNYVFRLEQHFASSGSAWTRKYKPINVLELIPDCDHFDEDKHTLKCMEKYGINNVRGGSFCEIKLSDDNIITLNQMIKGVTDKCYICGKKDHFAIDCKKHSIGSSIKNPSINVNEKCDCPTSYFSSHRRGKCLLNKIVSYFDDENDIIDKLLNLLIKHDDNKNNVNKNDDNKNNDNKHDDNKSNDNKHDDNKSNDNNKQTKNITCFKCGRIGHYSTSCYASKHVNGYYLKKTAFEEKMKTAPKI